MTVAIVLTVLAAALATLAALEQSRANRGRPLPLLSFATRPRRTPLWWVLYLATVAPAVYAADRFRDEGLGNGWSVLVAFAGLTVVLIGGQALHNRWVAAAR